MKTYKELIEAWSQRVRPTKEKANESAGSDNEVDTKGRTKAEWTKQVHAAHPKALVAHNPDGTSWAVVPHPGHPSAKKVHWIKDEGVFEAWSQRVRPTKEKPTTADHADMKSKKVGDSVYCLQPDDHTYKPGTIKRFGQTMIHVTHKDGSVAAYRPEHIGIRDDKGKKAFGESTVVDKKTGKKYDPEEEIEKMYKDPEYIAQMKRMKAEQGKGWPKRTEK